MIRRLAPSLATELHLTVRLLHVPPNFARSSRPRGSVSESHHGLSPRRSIAPTSSAVDTDSQQRQGQGDNRQEGDLRAKCLFQTGLDCRSFAARVLVGLNSLLPHIGADTLDLLAGSLALASEVSLVCLPLRVRSNPVTPPKVRSACELLQMYLAVDTVNIINTINGSCARVHPGLFLAASLKSVLTRRAKCFCKQEAIASRQVGVVGEVLANTILMTRPLCKTWARRLLLSSGGNKTPLTTAGVIPVKCCLELHSLRVKTTIMRCVFVSSSNATHLSLDEASLPRGIHVARTLRLPLSNSCRIYNF